MKFKHPLAIIPDLKWFENTSSDLHDCVYWIDEIYSEFSSFGLVWDDKIKAKRKEKKDCMNNLIIMIKDEVFVKK